MSTKPGEGQLTLDGVKHELPGAGVFPRYHDALCLTAPGATGRSCWRVPSWLAPREGVAPLGYHGDPRRWQVEGGELFLDAANRGQEFVLDAGEYPEALPWVVGLLEECVAGGGRAG